MAILEFARVNGTRYELADKQAREALETKAEIDGYYQDMTVGDAEQLVSSQYVEDNAPYKFRTSGGSADIGNREYVDKIVGGTIAWNQLNNNAQPTTTKAGITGTKNADGSWTINGTATANDDITFSTVHRVNGHKYMIFGCPSGGSASTYYVGAGGAVADVGSGGIYAAPNSNDGYFRLDFRTGATFDNAKVYPQFFDLTQMFGSAVADAVYAMEQATAGAGVAWFRKLFPNDYYEYNAGELISVSGLQSHDMVGFNQWDEQWELGYYANGAKVENTTNIRCKNMIQIIPETKYFINYSGNVNCFFNYYDANKNFLALSGADTAGRFIITGPSQITTPKNAHYMVFSMAGAYGTTYKHDICINLSWSGTRNGEYAAYEEHKYPLDSSLTLRGIPKLVDGEVKWDGDEYTPDGKVKRRYIAETFTGATSEDWSVVVGDVPRGVITRNTMKSYGSASSANFVCDKLIPDATGSTGTIRQYGSQIWIFPPTTVTDVAALRTWLAANPVTVIYELATSTEEEAESYTEVQIVNDWGTEEFISDSIVPVGHETRYPANLRDKLQHLPDMASGDGNYLIEQNGSQMTLVPFRIPKAPTEDGTYVLKATVSGGTPTYTWEAEE